MFVTNNVNLHFPFQQNWNQILSNGYGKLYNYNTKAMPSLHVIIYYIQYIVL